MEKHKTHPTSNEKQSSFNSNLSRLKKDLAVLKEQRKVLSGDSFAAKPVGQC